MEIIKVIQVGLGPIGQEIVKYALSKNYIEITGAVDPADDKAGKDLGELCSLDTKTGVTVCGDLEIAIKDVKPDVAVVATVSSFEQCLDVVERIVSAGINVVSTCEEMLYPWQGQPILSERLDRLAKEKGVSVLATGINPGFLMDFLPVVMTGVCQNVKRIKVQRVQDATFRRVPFQQKIGVGLSPEEFDKKKQAGTLRHVGLTESMHMIAAALGWQLDKTEDIISPVIADSEITSGYKVVKPGFAAGVRQTGKGYCRDEALIELEFVAAVGQDDAADTIEIKGTPDITSTIAGGVNGDTATCAITVNAIRSVTSAEPGLRTMLDVPVVSCYSKL